MYAQQYVQNDVISNDPVELVCLLYKKAIERLHRAKSRLAEGNRVGASEETARVMEIVLELIGSLDMEQGGEVAENLGKLYLYTQEQLAEAAGKHKRECLENAERVLSTLLEGWQECQSSLAVESAGNRVSSELTSAEEQGERAWTL